MILILLVGLQRHDGAVRPTKRTQMVLFGLEPSLTGNEQGCGRCNAGGKGIDRGVDAPPSRFNVKTKQKMMMKQKVEARMMKMAFALRLL